MDAVKFTVVALLIYAASGEHHSDRGKTNHKGGYHGEYDRGGKYDHEGHHGGMNYHEGHDERKCNTCCHCSVMLPTVDTSACSSVPNYKCPNIKYRTYDGSYSNCRYSHQGKSETAYTRLVPAQYADGKDKVDLRSRKCSAREISEKFFPDCSRRDQHNTVALMQWGQIVAHDCTHLKQRRANPNATCCTADNKVPKNPPDHCLPISVSKNDPCYKPYDIHCLNYTRAEVVDKKTTCRQTSEQVNANSGVIDASWIYGSDKETAESLRDNKDCCKLKVTVTRDGRHFPPPADNKTIPCIGNIKFLKEGACFKGGDDRVNQNTGITCSTICFVRYHNKLCDQLKQINPHWDCEKRYQEARKIVGAITQKITYNDYLPIILGKDCMRAKGLLVQDRPGCFNYHNPNVNPGVISEWAAGAFRADHSTVPSENCFVNCKWECSTYVKLHDFFFRPDIIVRNNNFDGCIRGIAAQPQQSQDQCIIKDLNCLLFKFKNPFGNDLTAIDINRGNDFGHPSYNQVRELCGCKKARRFEDLRCVMDEKKIKLLKSCYHSVDHVDMFVGGMLENKCDGALLGPTFSCIVAQQFYNFKFGDRFYYENCGQPWSFTPRQLHEINRVTLASVFCACGDNIRDMPWNVFKRPSNCTNRIVSCCSIPALDIRAWKEDLKYN